MTTRQAWARLNIQEEDQLGKMVMLTNVKHGVLWLGLVVYTVETRHVLKESVKIRMRTEWLGAFNTGGLDNMEHLPWINCDFKERLEQTFEDVLEVGHAVVGSVEKGLQWKTPSKGHVVIVRKYDVEISSNYGGN